VPWAPGDGTYGRLPTGDPTRRPAPGRARRPAWAGGPLTLALIAVNVLVSLVEVARPDLIPRYGLERAAVEAGEYERLLTSAFLHAGLLHLASNMLALFVVGVPLERSIGSVRFAVVYLASALGGSLLALALSDPYTLGVGASGAVFGLFGALAVLRRRVGAEATGVAVLIGLNLVISFTLPGISWQAHVGGLVTGAVVAVLVAGRGPRSPARR
jgi:membrane associated rhomboid family serine protease